MKYLKILTLIICIFFSINSTKAVEGSVEYNSVNINYKILNYKTYTQKGNDFLNKAEKTINSATKKNFYYGEALGAYTTSIEIEPRQIELYGKIGYIYGKMKQFSRAKEYLERGLNFDHNNPTVNFYFAGVYFDMENYNKAIKHYKIAAKYNYSNKYAVYYRLGETNELLGDLVKARDAYAKALSVKPNDTKLKQKIHSIDDLKYKNSKYYSRKKPFYYND